MNQRTKPCLKTKLECGGRFVCTQGLGHRGPHVFMWEVR